MECCTFTQICNNHHKLHIVSFTYIHIKFLYKKCSLGGRDIHVICKHPKHTHTCTYTSPSLDTIITTTTVTSTESPSPTEYSFMSKGHLQSLVCVYIVCECVNICVTLSSNLAPYSNHITGHTHTLTLTHTHPHSHSHVFAHRMCRPSLSPPHRTCLTLCLMCMAL